MLPAGRVTRIALDLIAAQRLNHMTRCGVVTNDNIRDLSKGIMMKIIQLGRISAVLVVVGGLVLGGCSSTSVPAAAGSTSASATATAPSPPATSPSAAGTFGSSESGSAATDLATATTKLGAVIVDAEGMAVYYFKPDVAGSGKSACSGDCLKAWPAVVPAAGKVTATKISATLGEISRTDGTKQITVNGRPVYLFQGDKAPGDINGQDVKKAWFLVSPSGAQIGG